VVDKLLTNRPDSTILKVPTGSNKEDQLPSMKQVIDYASRVNSHKASFNELPQIPFKKTSNESSKSLNVEKKPEQK